jgi:large subunit ribosomal protein L15
MSGELSKLRAPKGANRAEKRKGKGIAAGQGKTAGRGTKGQKARKSGHVRAGFEGGQMPIQRRLPKAGFKNPFKKEFAEVHLDDLALFAEGSLVSEVELRARGVVKGLADGVKILATGKLAHKVDVKVNRISKAAQAAIEGAGGKVEIIADREKWARTDTREARRAAKKSKSA